ncbi:MAG: hypothetical protein ACM3JD_12160 [Rudaea sp.]
MKGRDLDLWGSDDCRNWQQALIAYPKVIAAQGIADLAELDAWYGGELPRKVASREPPYITHDELVRVTRWKMRRGVWRERNRRLVEGNAAALVKQASKRAFDAVPDPRRPIAILSDLAGVGPATASAVLAAWRPDLYAFFDELVAAQIPGLGPVSFTAAYYARYADRLRERAAQLSAACKKSPLTPQDVSQALWANSGGKVAAGK